ncbi:Uncharacterized membrane protein YesL [Pseudobutyrivibrio sp. YE44]|uniref:YesL family protein n=1 Tax=Pseudobutyrivibrio sp. YE44 TaxID=1520802 RepID=UPI0008921687|nr:YesL family protein [Pseudobutyrivibrio sp. YE44]SDB29239.1 Uncharacterized membrane protein YesL [Pseudobutyrivibrio sp. YE44]
MGRFFNSRFFDSLTKATDVLILGFFFAICSIPVFTIGASATALYYTIHKVVYKGRGYDREFFRSFKENFKQATLSWLIFSLIFGILAGDIYITRNMLDPSSPFAAASIFFLVLFLLTMVWAIYHFSYIARFENGFKESFKVSFIFMILNLGWSMVIVLLCAAILVLMYYIPFLILFAPGLFACGLHPVLEKVFRKYMTPEDIAKEEDSY